MQHIEILVRRFYECVWNKADELAANAVLSPQITFRGSLGTSEKGIEGFLHYMRSIHNALGGYRCTILDLIPVHDRAAARMQFEGTHRGEFMGIKSTGTVISWQGAAFFEMQDRKLSDIWVLGDVDAIRRQLGARNPEALKFCHQDQDEGNG